MPNTKQQITKNPPRVSTKIGYWRQLKRTSVTHALTPDLRTRSVPCHFWQCFLSFLALTVGGSGLTMQDLKSRTAVLSLNKAIRSFNQGNTKAFEFIYRSYCEYVHRICLRMLRDPAEAEDAAQDVFVCVFRKISTFRGESAFSSWLYRLTTNSVLMRFRKNKRKWVSLEESREDERCFCRESSALDSNLCGLLDRIDLQSAVDVLPNGYKVAFVLHDVHGYDHREIAEMCGHSIGNSKSQLHKARVRLRKLIGGTPQGAVAQKANQANQFLHASTPDMPVKKKRYAAPFKPTFRPGCKDRASIRAWPLRSRPVGSVRQPKPGKARSV